MSANISNINVIGVDLLPMINAVVVTIDDQVRGRRLADDINTAARRVLQIAAGQIRLLGIDDPRAVTFDFNIPAAGEGVQQSHFSMADVNPAAIKAVHFTASDYIATVNLDAVEIYPGFLPETARYLDTVEDRMKLKSLPFGSQMLEGWSWSLN